MLIRSFASTFPKRFVMFRSSSIKLLLLHRVRDFDLTADDALSGRFDGLNRCGGDQVFVVLVQGIADAFVFKTINMDTADCPIIHTVLHDLVNRIVNTLHHARQNVTGFDPVLVRIDSDREPPGVTLAILAVLFNGIEGTESGIAGRRKNNVGALFDLSLCEFLSLYWIVPRCV